MIVSGSETAKKQRFSAHASTRNGLVSDVCSSDLEATRRIRALDREDAATTPIIAVSANAFADDRRLSREAGMNAHLSKPVSSQELVEALAHIAADAS